MRQGKLIILASLTVAAATLLTACGSSSKTMSSSAEVKKETCQQVEAVLSDGPDPEADPVGYAQAQVLPLRQIHTSDEKLHEAIDTLAAAYQAFYSTHAASQAKSAVNTASKAIDTVCPGAAS